MYLLRSRSAISVPFLASRRGRRRRWRRYSERAALTIDIPQAELDDLRERLARTRRTPREVHDWSRGTQTDALDALLAHWAGAYDWRAAERRLNGLDADGTPVAGAGARRHVMVDVDGQRIHAML